MAWGAAQFQCRRAGARAHEAHVAPSVIAGSEVTGINQGAHGALGHLVAERRRRPARGGKVRAVQRAVLSQGQQHA